MAGKQQSPPSTSSPGSPPPAAAKPRNQNACDSCRSRKVKCRFDDAAACRVCVDLDIPCTFNRPRRRRGPPNRHVQAIRSAMGVDTDSALGSVSAASTSVTATATAASASPSDSCSPASGGHWLSLFAPAATIDRLLSEWFRQIHPIAPILHRRQFMHRLRRGDAEGDRIFCGLVVSVCAATVATLRRSNHEPVTIEYCVAFVEQHQLLRRGLLDRNSYSLDWCIAMYNLGNALGSVAGMDDLRAYHMGSEAAIGVRYLVYYHLAEMAVTEQQLLKRLFWLLFAWSCSADLFGRVSIPLFMCEEHFHHMQMLSLTDAQLDPEATAAAAPEGEPWEGDSISYVPGLTALSDLFLIWCNARRRPQPTTPAESQAALVQNVAAVQRILDGLPPELRWRGGLSRPAGVTQGHDAQVANLFVTSLHLKSNLLQKFGPADGSGDEHQRLVDDLLEILYHMPRAIFEANGSSIVPKIRDIGAAYLDQVRNSQQTGDQRSGNNSNNDNNNSNNDNNNSSNDTNRGNQWISGPAKDKLERLLRRLDDLDFWPTSLHSRIVT